jgi:mRNA interferase MazF
VKPTPRRGEIWWASLPAPRGSEPGFRRPVVIVQSNRFNVSALPTVLVAVVTSNLRLADAPGNVRLRPADSGLSKPSVVNVSQLITVNRELVTEQVGVLPAAILNEISSGLRLVLAL